MLGSTTLHGWVESAWYLSSYPQDEDEEAEVTMEREFRGAGLHHKLDIRVAMGEMGVPDYSVQVMDHQPKDSAPKRAKAETIVNDILTVISSRDGVAEGYIKANTGYNDSQVRETIDMLIQKGECYRRAGKVYLRSNEK